MNSKQSIEELLINVLTNMFNEQIDSNGWEYDYNTAKQLFEQFKAQEQKPITAEEIDALAEKEYPLAMAVDNSELSPANKEYNAMQDIKAIHFIKGFKAALKLK